MVQPVSLALVIADHLMTLLLSRPPLLQHNPNLPPQYKSREALTAHIKSPHFQKLGTKLGQYTTSGPMKIMAPVVVSGNKL